MAYTSAVNMAQFAIMSNDPLVQAVTFSLIDAGSVMARDIPFVNRASLVANGVRWEGSLPTPDWVPLNTDPTVTSGTPTPFQEQAYILRNEIQVDKVLVNDQNAIVDPRAAQVEAFLKAAAYDFNFKFIGNNHVTGDSDAFVGLRYRLDNYATYGVRSENKIDAGAVDLRAANMTAATFNSFMVYLDQALWSVGSEEGDGVILYVNETLKRRMAQGMRQFAGQGGFGQATDQFGRTAMTYKGATIRDIGRKADQSTLILTSTETSAGVDGSDVHTSVYAVRYGDGAFMGWQFEPLQAKDLGLRDGGVVYSTLIDWTGGLYPVTNRCFARVYGIKMS